MIILYAMINKRKDYRTKILPITTYINAQIL